jgi:hypothetical protein
MGNVTKEGAISRYTTIQEKKKQRDTELVSVINHTTTKKYKPQILATVLFMITK